MGGLGWLVDPPHLLHEYDPLRQWSIGARDLPEGCRLEFVAVGQDGAERFIGAMDGRRNVAVQIITNANETLRILAGQLISAPTPVVFQRWIVPFASIPLDGVPTALSAAGGVVGVRGSHGETQVVRLAPGGVTSTNRLSHGQQLDAALQRVVASLGREEGRHRGAWGAAAQIDRGTVAVAHGRELLIGTVGPMTKM